MCAHVGWAQNSLRAHRVSCKARSSSGGQAAGRAPRGSSPGPGRDGAKSEVRVREGGGAGWRRVVRVSPRAEAGGWRLASPAAPRLPRLPVPDGDDDTRTRPGHALRAPELPWSSLPGSSHLDRQRQAEAEAEASPVSRVSVAPGTHLASRRGLRAAGGGAAVNTMPT